MNDYLTVPGASCLVAEGIISSLTELNNNLAASTYYQLKLASSNCQNSLIIKHTFSGTLPLGDALRKYSFDFACANIDKWEVLVTNLFAL